MGREMVLLDLLEPEPEVVVEVEPEVVKRLSMEEVECVREEGEMRFRMAVMCGMRE